MRSLSLALFFVATACGLSATSVARAQHDEARPLDQTLVDGDRVVLLGSTFIERAQRFGHLETELIAANPEANLVVRNLGWSGDTVFAESRGIFDPPEAGYARMLEHVARLKPTVVVIAYGANESFAGPDGLPRFIGQLEKLIGDMESMPARIVLATPTPLENVGPPLADPTPQNENLALYADAIRQLGVERGFPVIDMFGALLPLTDDPDFALTYNGLHFDEQGYRVAARLLASQWSDGAWDADWSVDLNVVGGPVRIVSASGVELNDFVLVGNTLEFTALDNRLPNTPLAGSSDDDEAGAHARLLKISGLRSGAYTLTIDGEPVAEATADQWRAGYRFDSLPDLKQLDDLRAAIVQKNEFYFHRWRPQNITYLFGFRKHEQGQNAAEVSEFDKFVEKMEAGIYELKQPRKRTYKLTREQ